MIFYLMVAFVVFLDQATKFFALVSLSSGDSLPILPNIFHLTLVHNTGIAFGLFRQHPSFLLFLITVSIVALIWIAYRLHASSEKPHPLMQWGLALILGGAIGNWIDRLVHGAVIDFLDFRIWPVFNLADSAITIGAVMYLLLFLRKHSS